MAPAHLRMQWTNPLPAYFSPFPSPPFASLSPILYIRISYLSSPSLQHLSFPNPFLSFLLRSVLILP